MSSAVIAPESLLRTIASLQSELSSLQSALGAEGVTFTPFKGGKVKKVKDPNAEPKEANVWIKFTQRVGALIKGAHPDNKAPATIGKQFCSFLKEQKTYDEWADEEIVAAFDGWTPPEQSKMAAAGKTKAKGSSSDSGSVSEASEKKTRGPLSEEAKAARKEKMAATKAGKAAAAAAVDAVSALAPPPPTTAPPTAFKPKTVTPSYTMEQLTDLDGFEHQGKSYGRNVRGDVVAEDGSYIGHWDGKTVKAGPAPADWEAIKAAM